MQEEMILTSKFVLFLEDNCYIVWTLTLIAFMILVILDYYQNKKSDFSEKDEGNSGSKTSSATQNERTNECNGSCCDD